ncbi:hypothetical protein MSIMFB_02258 [Mycobacterium simulans]|uniref:PE domain-containing protein n=1 Tax=Mycobacterium simulans TaxID=627089 RepID=A0A7Z7N9G1_9MYCO|nr:PE family protein [Mycobacterium simulans]SOJ54765.1 hypothetical protein MSIMFB_02258 [Mycobacterium simulans]
MIRTANVAAAAPTTSLIAAAQDEVSATNAALVSRHAQDYQAPGTVGVAGNDDTDGQAS